MLIFSNVQFSIINAQFLSKKEETELHFSFFLELNH